MVLNDAGVIGLSLNGKSFPATQPYTAKVGDWILIHYFNEGTQIHPMHLHQFDQVVVAKDGYPLDAPYTVDTLNVAPGERYSVLVQVDRARRLGVALPHPPPRRVRGGDVRDGHRDHRRESAPRYPASFLRAGEWAVIGSGGRGARRGLAVAAVVGLFVLVRVSLE